MAIESHARTTRGCFAFHLERLYGKIDCGEMTCP